MYGQHGAAPLRHATRDVPRVAAVHQKCRNRNVGSGNPDAISCELKTRRLALQSVSRMADFRPDSCHLSRQAAFGEVEACDLFVVHDVILEGTDLPPVPDSSSSRIVGEATLIGALKIFFRTLR
jgi:hypothetical protein